MAEARRISVEQARRNMEQGNALLVCAYSEDDKCNQMKIDGSLSLSELQPRIASLPKNQEIIFYCG